MEKKHLLNSNKNDRMNNEKFTKLHKYDIILNNIQKEKAMIDAR